MVGCLGDHRQHTLIGVVSIGGANVAADGPIEAFQPAGGAQISAQPSGVCGFQTVVGDGAAEVAAEGFCGFGLGAAVLAPDRQVAPQGGAEVFGSPDGLEIPQDGAALAPAFGGRPMSLS